MATEGSIEEVRHIDSSWANDKALAQPTKLRHCQVTASFLIVKILCQAEAEESNALFSKLFKVSIAKS